MIRTALDKNLHEVREVRTISLDVRRYDEDGRTIERRMLRSFNWLAMAEANPNMTAEEIASAAASCAESP